MVEEIVSPKNMAKPLSLLSAYDSNITELTQTPNDPVLQHRAVLALARAGSLDFAWAEYRRYGLDKFTTHQDPKLLEDIMGLGARLLKDLFLASSGKAAKNYAVQSSEKYEAAYQITGGFYSGINAATMGLMGGMPGEIIKSRAQDLLRQLPPLTELDKETLYFIEATRAEALLILGETYKARQTLRRAIRHDPRNYIAHASTLRQFKMILEKRGEDIAWLSAFEPPKPVHFSGHLFDIGTETKRGVLSTAARDQLKIDISDSIQINDIGFGYGSLAAGSDILIAEVLIDEGCDLHVTLPVEPDVFLEHSVAPFGADWASRFQSCWDEAVTRDVVGQSSIWPKYETDRFSNNVTMGKAILHSQHLSVGALQLLIWDQKTQNMGTGRSASDWSQTGRKQIVLPYPAPRKKRVNPKNAVSVAIQVSLFDQEANTELYSPDIYEMVQKAFDIQSKSGYISRIGLHIDILPTGSSTSETARQLAENSVPGGILISESAVSVLLLQHADKFTMDYMGRLGSGDNGIRAFALKRKG